MFKELQTREMLFGSGSLFLFLASAFMIMAIIGGIIMLARGDNQYPSNVITVNGMGEVDAVPDVATFTFNARVEADTVAAGQTQVNETIDAVLVDLVALGIDEKDIKTISRNANERFEYNSSICREGYCPPSGEREVVGYEVSQRIQLTVRDLDMIGDIDAVFGENGITDYYGPNFTIDDPSELETQAKEIAIADAKEKAERLAKELDVRLGKLVNYGEIGDGYYPVERMAFGMGGDMAMSESAAPKAQLPAGEQTVMSNVMLTYRIK